MVTITCAAIWNKGTVYFVPAPGRHHNVIKMMREKGVSPHLGTQGFVTSTGEFVDRQEAVKIAAAAGQIKNKTQPEHELFSEDLW